MDIITLIVTACLIKEPEKCKEYHLSFPKTEYLNSPYSCAMKAQVEIVKFMEVHPDERVSKYKCVLYDKNSKKT